MFIISGTARTFFDSDPLEVTTDDEADTGDSSYRFAIDTDEYQRQESSDPHGNVQGSYSYRNKDGEYALSYIAGSNTGFIATGGNLATPAQVSDTAVSISSRHSGTDPRYDAQTSGDGSYSFSVDTDEYQRKESSDSSGNVEGKYSYQNKEGSHDLTYKAGAQRGFVATGGSLAVPNGLESSFRSHNLGYHDSLSKTDDGSYNFKIDTDNYQREESSDSSGNVKGRYSYKDDAGTHDLSYVAGKETGFVTTGGSLKEHPGSYSSHLQAVQMPHQGRHPAVNGIVLKSFIPLVADKNKYGYIFESQY